MLCDYKNCNKKRASTTVKFCKEHKNAKIDLGPPPVLPFSTPISHTFNPDKPPKRKCIVDDCYKYAKHRFNLCNKHRKKEKKLHLGGKKKKRKTVYEKQQKTVEDYARKLQTKTPRSEVWFQYFYNRFKDDHDIYNCVISNKIADILNRKLKYAIEIDGTWHDRPGEAAKDARKNAMYARLGYKVIRIYYNKDKLDISYTSLRAGLDAIFSVRKMPSFSFKIKDVFNGGYFEYSYVSQT